MSATAVRWGPETKKAQMCTHEPPCPPPTAPDHDAARIIASHPEQGWTLLCNGVILFEDTGELLPDGAVVLPHRPTDIGATLHPRRS